MITAWRAHINNSRRDHDNMAVRPLNEPLSKCGRCRCAYACMLVGSVVLEEMQSRADLCLAIGSIRQEDGLNYLSNSAKAAWIRILSDGQLPSFLFSILFSSITRFKMRFTLECVLQSQLDKQMPGLKCLNRQCAGRAESSGCMMNPKKKKDLTRSHDTTNQC